MDANDQQKRYGCQKVRTFHRKCNVYTTLVFIQRIIFAIHVRFSISIHFLNIFSFNVQINVWLNERQPNEHYRETERKRETHNYSIMIWVFTELSMLLTLYIFVHEILIIFIRNIHDCFSSPFFILFILSFHFISFRFVGWLFWLERTTICNLRWESIHSMILFWSETEYSHVNLN